MQNTSQLTLFVGHFEKGARWYTLCGSLYRLLLLGRLPFLLFVRPTATAATRNGAGTRLSTGLYAGTAAAIGTGCLMIFLAFLLAEPGAAIGTGCLIFLAFLLVEPGAPSRIVPAVPATRHLEHLHRFDNAHNSLRICTGEHTW